MIISALQSDAENPSHSFMHWIYKNLHTAMLRIWFKRSSS